MGPGVRRDDEELLPKLSIPFSNRQRESSCTAVIASEAKQSILPRRKSGLLRRGVYHQAGQRPDPLAPRNDAALTPHMTSRLAARCARVVHLSLAPFEGVGNAGCPLHPRSRVHLVVVERTRVTTSTPESPGIPARNGFNGLCRALVSAKSARMCERAVLTNRPSLDLSPFVLEGHRACRGAWDRSGVFLNPNSCMGFEPEPSKEGSWMMAQNDLIVAGIDVAKDKVDVCIRSLSLRRTFASTAEGRRELASWLRRKKVGKAVMEASGVYEREWAKALRDAKIEVRIVDPKRVRSFALSAGRLAKNDTIDAEMIAWFAETFSAAPGQPHDAAREELRALVKARKHLLDLQTRLKSQNEHAATESV